MKWEPWKKFNEPRPMLPIIGPPCRNCRHWYPIQRYGEDNKPQGVQLCHSEQQQDFSCFANHEPVHGQMWMYAGERVEIHRVFSDNVLIRVMSGGGEKRVSRKDFESATFIGSLSDDANVQDVAWSIDGLDGLD